MNISTQRCYELLELPVGSSLEEVKNAYRQMTKVWHPDRFTSDPHLHQKAEERFKHINVAFQILQSELQKAAAQRKQIDLVYEILEDHLAANPATSPGVGAGPLPDAGSGRGTYAQGKKALKRITITPRFLVGSALVVAGIVIYVLSTPEEKTYVANAIPAPDLDAAPKPSLVSLHEGKINELSKPVSLSEEDKAYYLRLRGYDPEKFQVSDFGHISPKTTQERTAPTEFRMPLPKTVKFCVVAGDATYLTEKEPKPTEGGYKIIAYPKGNEVLATGKVQIFHLNN